MPLPAETRQINRPSIRDEVYNKLLSWIMKGILKPGEKILDKELAKNMGVSRTPVREALRRLEDKDLIESSANRWTRVSKISASEPGLIYPIIWTLDGLAAATAAPALTDKDFKKMTQANTALKTALEENDPVGASKADAEFHDVYIQRSQNHHLIKILHDLKIRYRRFEVAYFNGGYNETRSLDEHEAILLAFKKKDIELAIHIIQLNWQNSLEQLEKIKINPQ